jgi:hypothetical protein
MNKGEITMNGFDYQSATEVAIRLAGVARRANLFGHSRERIIEEILFLAEDYAKVAAQIEVHMEKEAA